jgi:hypothetical protein
MINIATSKAKTIQADATITAATNAAPIAITTGANHGYETGDIVQHSGILGNLAANGQFVITVTGPATYTLNNSNGSGAYTSGGTSKHIGFATAAALIDNTIFPNGPLYYSLGFRLEQLSAGSSVRALFEDTSDAAFVTAQPGPSFAFNGVHPLIDPQTYTRNFPDFSILQLGQAGNNLRVKVFIAGGPGSSCTFSAWLA